MKILPTYSASAALLLFAASASAADTSGSSLRWRLLAGASTIRPTTSTSQSGAKVEFQAAETAVVSLSYTFTPRSDVELWIAAPSKHDIEYNGMRVANTDFLPINLTLQYELAPSWVVRPIVGLGINLTEFTGETLRPEAGGGDLKLERTINLTAQAGLLYDLNSRWLLSADLRWWNSDPLVYVNGMRIQTFHIDPLAVSVNVGWRF